jgi:hypothetical protein
MAMGKSAQDLKFLRATSVMVQELQMERGTTVRYALAAVGEQELNEQRAKTDKALEVFRPLLEKADIPSEQRDRVMSSIDSYNELRTRITQNPITAALARDLMTVDIGSFLALSPAIAATERETQYGSPISSIVILEHAKEAAGLMRVKVTQIAKEDKPISLGEASSLLDITGKLTSNLDSPAVFLSAGEETIRTLRDHSARRMAEGASRNFLSRYTEGSYDIDPNEFFSDMTEFVDTASQVILAEIDQQLHHAQTQELRMRIIFIASLVIVIVGYGAITLVSMVLALSVVKAAKSVSASLREIAEGGGDLTGASSWLRRTSSGSWPNISTASSTSWRTW